MNTSMSLLNRFAILISGLILPRLILLYYGSEVNGLVASINQFLSIITFLDLGVGAVVQSALYRPLAKNDTEKMSQVLVAAKNYFRKIAYFLVAYIILLIIFYPLLIDSSFSFLPTTVLIFSLSLGIFAQYYFGIINELLLNADQRGYVQLFTEIIVVLMNLIASVFLITNGAPIHIVKLVAGVLYLFRPIYLSYYVNKNFEIHYDVEIKEDPLPQKWSGMGQHIAYTIQDSTDIVTLTLFSSLENVSVYSVYNMVVQSIRLIISSLSTGIGSFFGSLLANEEIDLLNKYFSKIEWLTHTGVVYLYGMTAVLINSFVRIYTGGVNDIDYYAPLFSLLLVLSKSFYSLRTPYQSIILAAGHFKETQKSSFIEAGMNVVISVIMVRKYGLIGITVGTLISMIYRTLYLVNYLSKTIVFRSRKIFAKQIMVDILSFSIMLLIGFTSMNFYEVDSLISWVLLAGVLGISFIVLLFFINYIFYKENTFEVMKRFKIL